MSTPLHQPTSPSVSPSTFAIDGLVDSAHALVPILRARAADAEAARRIQDETISDAETAGFLRMMVPKSLGGLGLGITELCDISRILAQGDTSAAWVISFLIEHNWLACRLPETAQQRLYKSANHVNTASTLQPLGRAKRADNGFVVTGRWPYSSGIHHSPWTFVNVRVETDGVEEFWVMLLPVTPNSVIDDWYMSGMAGTGSATFIAEDCFVPLDMAIPMNRMVSANDHFGTHHPEPVYHQPVLPAAAAMLTSFPLGAAQGALALAQQRLTRPNAAGQKLLDHESVKVRWAQAHQQVRIAELLWRNLLAKIDEKQSQPWSDAELAQIELDRVSIVQNSKESTWLLLEGLGSSASRLEDPLQRYARDIQVLASHVAHSKDNVFIKAASLLFS